MPAILTSAEQAAIAAFIGPIMRKPAKRSLRKPMPLAPLAARYAARVNAARTAFRALRTTAHALAAQAANDTFQRQPDAAMPQAADAAMQAYAAELAIYYADSVTLARLYRSNKRCIAHCNAIAQITKA